MHIEYLEADQRDKWQEWVTSNPLATFYHRIEWKDVIEASFKHKTFYLLAMEKGQIEGVLPLVRIHSMLFGKIFCSMPFLNFGGICAKSPEAYQCLIDACQELLTNNKSDYVEFRHLHPSPIKLKRKGHKVSMTIELDPDPDVLWNNFKSKHRTNIRRAQKNGLEIVRGGGENLEEFYKIICIGWRDLGTPIYKIEFFKNILNAFDNSVEIYLVKYQGKTIATAFNGLFRDTVEGMWTFAVREHAKLQTNYFLYWEMIKDACIRGYKLYHLGRSTNNSGATFFKSKWNAKIHQLYWEYILNEGRCSDLPELNVDNPKYKFAINAWRRLPVGVSQRIGPFLSKSLP
jgi:FemAB-related protein (PEP-CTERM system-associated)